MEIWNVAVSWREHALCTGLGDIFFMPDGPEADKAKLARESEAKAICARCPVNQECLETGLQERQDRFGIWAGFNPVELRALRREHGVIDHQGCPKHGTIARYLRGCRCLRCDSAVSRKLKHEVATEKREKAPA